jgi:hypothetical protein
MFKDKNPIRRVRNLIKLGNSSHGFRMTDFYFPCHPKCSEGTYFLMFFEKKEKQEILCRLQNDKEDFPFSEIYQPIFDRHPEDVSPKDLFLNSIKTTNFSPKVCLKIKILFLQL